jgi:hypothetical protein
MDKQRQHGQVFVRRFEFSMNRIYTFIVMSILTVALFACGGGGAGSVITSDATNATASVILQNSIAATSPASLVGSSGY